MLRLACAAALSAFLISVAIAQEAPAGIKRTPLQALDFPAGYKTVMGIAEIAPGASSGRHTHPGIETGYVLEGEVVMSVEGQADQTLKAGDSYQIAAGVPHDVKSTGTVPAKAIATYVVEASKPLASPAK